MPHPRGSKLDPRGGGIFEREVGLDSNPTSLSKKQKSIIDDIPFSGPTVGTCIEEFCYNGGQSTCRNGKFHSCLCPIEFTGERFCYNCAIYVLQFCYNSATIVLQFCYNFATIVLQFCYNFATILLQFCYKYH